MTTVASFNVNSLRARIDILLGWLKTAAPDVVLLQEIKCLAEQVPVEAIGDLGYNVAAVGQKSYNGVAILSKHPITVEHEMLPGGEDDPQARYLEALIDVPVGDRRAALRVASIYLPNGNPVESEKFPYKLAWLKRLTAHAAAVMQLEEITVLGGDYNVIPTDLDVYDPVAWASDALCQPESRALFRRLLNMGYVDAWRSQHPGEIGYTFWDYMAGHWQKDEGLRIDHLLLSPQAADRLQESGVDRAPRKLEKPSDHTPVWCRLAL